ncbi:MAG TPA: hypothetical protein VG754_00840 [Verrucomicrobiae bacterium]|nr:hypothetical protein [Verrucomicrobiae bacterium]
MPESNDPLEALLHENDPYLEDGGFTARVVASLPPRRKSWLRPAILSGATLIGLALLIWLAPFAKDALSFDASGEISVNLNPQSVITLAVLLMGAASLGWGLFAMLKWED